MSGGAGKSSIDRAVDSMRAKGVSGADLRVAARHIDEGTGKCHFIIYRRYLTLSIKEEEGTQMLTGLWIVCGPKECLEPSCASLRDMCTKPVETKI